MARTVHPNAHLIMLDIKSNGSKWYGEPPDDIDELLKVLLTQPLDRSLEAFLLPDPNPHGLNWKPLFENLCTWSFFGNFYRGNHVFKIFTDEVEIVERLRTAIAINMASSAYLEQRPPRFHLACCIHKRQLVHIPYNGN